MHHALRTVMVAITCPGSTPPASVLLNATIATPVTGTDTDRSPRSQTTAYWPSLRLRSSASAHRPFEDLQVEGLVVVSLRHDRLQLCSICIIAGCSPRDARPADVNTISGLSPLLSEQTVRSAQRRINIDQVLPGSEGIAVRYLDTGISWPPWLTRSATRSFAIVRRSAGQDRSTPPASRCAISSDRIRRR